MLEFGPRRRASAYPSLAIHAAAALLSLVLISLLILRVSDAAFSATTQNPGDQWTAGDVALSDDDLSDTAMFAVTAMVPSQVETECITVTYSGSLNAAVKLYGTISAGNGLHTYLNLRVRRGTGGTFGDCTGFSTVETVYTGTLAGFMTSHGSFALGAGTWAPTGGGPDDDMTYEFQVTLQDNNLAQGLTTTATFTWEAQNT